MSTQNLDTNSSNENPLKQTLIRKLKTLQAKAEEIASDIATVDKTFQDLGLNVTFDVKNDVSKKPKALQSGIRIGGLLSFRGKEKAKEQFRMMDSDNDGLMNYEDFRAIRSFGCPGGFVQDQEYRTWETWKLHMEDIGLSPTMTGGLSINQYVAFRENAEAKQPLSTELQALSMGFLPPPQKIWIEKKAMLNEFIDFRESRKPLTMRRIDMIDETLSLDDISFIVNNLGFKLTKPELNKMMLHRARKQRMQEEIVRIYSKRKLGQLEHAFKLHPSTGRLLLGAFKQEERIITVENFSKVNRSDLLPWIIAYPDLNKGTKEFYRYLIVARSMLLRGVRIAETVCRHMFNFAAHANDRLIFRDFGPFNKLPKPMIDISTYKFATLVGDEDDRDGGISGSMKLMRIDNAAPAFKALGVPVDSGLSCTVDFLFNPEVSDEDGTRTAELLKQFLGHHLERDMRTNRLFNGIRVVSAVNDSDESKVLRIIFSYKRLVSFDGFLEHMLIPYKLADLVSVFVVDFRTNVDLGTLFSSKLTSLSETFAGSVDCTIGLRRMLLITLLKRLTLAMKAAITNEQAELVKKKGAEEAEDDSLPNKEEEEMNRRLFRWKYVQQFAQAVGNWTQYFTSTLKCMHTGMLRLKFISLAELLHKLSINVLWLRSSFPVQWVCDTGLAKRFYDDKVIQYSSEFTRLYFMLKEHLEAKKKADDWRRKEELMAVGNANEDDKNDSDASESEKEQQRQLKAKRDQQAITLERLKRIGVDTTKGAELFDEGISDPDEACKAAKEESMKQDVQGLILLEHLKLHVIGFHSLEIISGKSKLHFALQGFDIFDLLPELPSMSKVQQDTQLRTD